MKKGIYRHKMFLKRRANRLHLRMLNFKRKHKIRLIQKANYYSLDKKKVNNENKQNGTITFNIPLNFELLNNDSNVLEFILRLFNCKKDPAIKAVKLDLRNLKKFDIAAICILLSVINDLSLNNIAVRGNYPRDESCKKLFEESGFLEHMADISGSRIQRNSEKNLIIETGLDKTSNEKTANAISDAMEYITGNKRRFQPAYTVAMEMCTNSVEHAYRINKHWLLGVHQSNGDIIFTMTDTGYGIFKTLRKKHKREIEKILKLTNDCDILYRAFKRKYGSATMEVNRNRGLPCILSAFESGYIKDLKVITNKVYLDFKNRENSRILNIPFTGVFFCWRVDKECIELFDNNAE